MKTLKRKLFTALVVPLFAVGIFLSPLALNSGISTGGNIAYAQTGGATTSGCSFYNAVVDPAVCIAAAANQALRVAGFFAGLGGVALNQAIDITILQMGTIVNSSEGITTAWTILRDLANIGLIFGLLAIGIATILQIAGYGMKELLAKLIVIALLINFSLFVTKAIIDVGNAVAVVAFKQLNIRDKNICPEKSTSCIADKFMDTLKLPTIYDTKGARVQETNATSGLSPGNTILAGVFGSIVMLIAGFVFLAGAVLLIIRFVILVLLMVVSPIAWASYILPNTRLLWSKWWSTLWREVIFAPAYLILLLATLWIAQDTALSNATGGTDGSYARAILGEDVSSLKVFVHFGIIIGFMISSLILAKMIGSTGSGAITGYGKKLAKNAGFALAGVAGRNTIGRGSAVAKNLYDITQTTGVGRATRGLATGLSLGLLSDRNITKVLDAGQSAKFGSGESFKGAKEYGEKRGKELRKLEIQREKTAEIVRGIKDPEGATKLEAVLRSIRNEELEDLELKQILNVNVLSNLSSAQLDHLAKSDKFSPQDKQKIKSEREGALRAKMAAVGGTAGIRAILKNPAETAKLPTGILTEKAVALELSAADLGAIARENKSEADRDKIRAHIEAEYKLLDSAYGADQLPPKLKKAYEWLNTGPGRSLF